MRHISWQYLWHAKLWSNVSSTTQHANFRWSSSFDKTKKMEKNNIPCIHKESQYLITRNTLSFLSDYFGKHYSVTTGQQKKAFYQSRCLLCIHVIGWVKGQMLLVCTTLEYKDNSHCVSSRRIKFLKGIVPSVCLLIPCSARKLTKEFILYYAICPHEACF